MIAFSRLLYNHWHSIWLNILWYVARLSLLLLKAHAIACQVTPIRISTLTKNTALKTCFLIIWSQPLRWALRKFYIILMQILSTEVSVLIGWRSCLLINTLTRLIKLRTLSSHCRSHHLLLSLSLYFSCCFLQKTSRFYLYLVRILHRCASNVEAAVVRSVHIDCYLWCSLSTRVILLLVLNHLDFTLELKLSLGKGLLKQGNMDLSLF